MQQRRVRHARLGSSTRLKTYWLMVVVVACLAFASASPAATSIPAGTECQQPRVRKSWDAYNASEKTLYLNAVGLAMRRGLHQKFVQLHVEYLSELEAHRNCMFIYWHRLYLLGYENMLRSLSPEYICVTIPVWDHLAATARRTAGVCANMEECAPIIRDFGGSTVGVKKNLVVYNQTITSTTSQLCVTQGVVANFCGNNTVCAGCIVRGQPTATAYPPDAYFGSVYNQMFTYDTWNDYRTAIEGGVHNSIHSKLGGTMAYLQSPVDPLFYTHHALIDALQTIYVTCQLTTNSNSNNNETTTALNATQKASDPRFFANCARRSTGTFVAKDEVYMALQNFGNKWVHVRKDPNNLLYQYFKDLPSTFGALVDATDLGNYSYTYDLTGALSNMQTNCKASNTIASTTAAVLLADDGDNNKGGNAADSATRHWAIALYESARLNGYDAAAADEQMELITCQHKHECIGAIEDYSALFRANFHVDGHPRCFTLVQALARGDKVIGIPHWRDITRRFVPCANEHKSVQSLADRSVKESVEMEMASVS